jgi:uncharacterized membrane protein
MSAAELATKEKKEQAAKKAEDAGNAWGCFSLFWIGNAVLAGFAKGAGVFVLALFFGPLVWLVPTI